MSSTINHLSALLDHAAAQHAGNHIIVYGRGDTNIPKQITYNDLRTMAITNSKVLQRLDGIAAGSIVLLHFEDHLDNIVWLWSTVLAGCIPAMSNALPRDPKHCLKHLAHLQEVLEHPVCLTRSSLKDQFPDSDGSNLAVVEVDHINEVARKHIAHTTNKNDNKNTNLALLMLTSGSTGNAKAVCLTHEQIMASVQGKSSALPVTSAEIHNNSCMNWIRLDHVGSLIEIHMHALYLGVSQVHIAPDDIIANPLLFLEKIHHHRVVRTFAPNFFLAELARALEASAVAHHHFDLTCLKYIISGGEANPVATCVRISQLLRAHGAPDNVVVPGFGMTETCAGSIYNSSCPAYDVAQGHEFASLGRCVPGIQMRVVGAMGNLEISGSVVFARYYNNETATAEAFTADGWFKTGDTASIDEEGNLNLSGRTKDLIAINGVKFLPKELDAAIEEAQIEGVTPGFVVCFATRASGAETEQICVVYLPSYAGDDVQMRYQVQTAITRTVLPFAGSRPFVLPLSEEHLQRTTLGKLPGAKLRTALERGDFHPDEAENERLLQRYQDEIWCPPASQTEQAVLEELASLLAVPEKTIGVGASMFETGLTSVDLLKLKRRLELRLHLDEIPLITLMTHASVRSLARVLDITHISDTTTPAYHPVVRLQIHGAKPPLWLIHPGVGEILVFLHLAKFLTDRPVFALRARGFHLGERPFASIADAVATYHAAIKREQRHGPYAIAGYSYGSMLAFEVAKVLEAHGDDVRFVGCFNLPPHIKFRMRQLDWSECLLHLAFFLDLVSEEKARALAPEIAGLERTQAVAQVIWIAAVARLAELSLTAEKLEKWATLAFGLQSMAREYEPEGSVRAMDVFYCHPLAVVAKSKEDWLQGHLHKWSDFVRSDVRFHDVEGHHYTMLAPVHIGGFQAALRKALQARGL